MKTNDYINHFNDPTQYMKTVKDDWTKFIETGSTSGLSVRSEVLESWKLSLQNGIPFSDSGAALILDKKEMSKINAENYMLISAAQPLMEDFAFMLKQRGSVNNVVNLCNMDTVILKTIASGNPGETDASVQNLIPGAILNEKYTGTTGVSMVKNTFQPYAIYGAEHFPQSAKSWSCAAAPIQNISNNEFRGIISLSGENMELTPDTLGMITFVAHAIESRYYHLYYEAMKVIDAKYKTILKKKNASLILALDSQLNIIASSKNIHSALSNTLNVRKMDPTIYKAAKHEAERCWRNPESKKNFIESEKNVGKYVVSFNKVYLNEELAGMILCINDEPDVNSTLHPVELKSKGTTVAIGSVPIFTKALNTALHVADTDASVMLLGETGVGKEVFAKTIYENSSRTEKPFVAVNCGALPKELIGSELFGYAPGAFTGALAKGNPGKIEAANGGTLFLDELESLPLDAQSYLLRVIEEKELFRLGSNQPIPVDVRIISSTNVNLKDSIEKQQFRPDLFYRLNVIEILIPPLRKRFADLSELISYLNSLFNDEECFVTEEDLEYIQRYSWPGNVRELKNVIQSASVLRIDTVQSIKDYVQKNIDADEMPVASQSFGSTDDNDIERIVAECGGNVSKAAKQLGVARSTIYRQMKKKTTDKT